MKIFAILILLRAENMRKAADLHVRVCPECARHGKWDDRSVRRAVGCAGRDRKVCEWWSAERKK